MSASLSRITGQLSEHPLARVYPTVAGTRSAQQYRQGANLLRSRRTRIESRRTSLTERRKRQICSSRQMAYFQRYGSNICRTSCLLLQAMWPGAASPKNPKCPPRRWRRSEHQVVYCFPRARDAAGDDMPGAGDDMRPGHRASTSSGIAPRQRTTSRPFHDASGKHHGVSIPPPLIRKELTDAFEITCARRVAALHAEAVKTPTDPFDRRSATCRPANGLWPRCIDGRAPSSRVAYGGAGVSKAALDAQCLAQELENDGDVVAALSRYEKARSIRAKSFARIRAISEPNLEGLESTRDPARLIREYGAQMLLRDVEVSDFRSALTRQTYPAK